MQRVNTQGKVKHLAVFFLVTFCFALFYIPADYAISKDAYNIWRIAICITSCVIIVVYLARCRISLRWLAFVLFLLAYYLISTVLEGSDGSRLQIAYNLLKVGGFITLLEYGFSTNKEMYLQAFIVAGILLCAVHYTSFLQYRDYPHGMREWAYITVGDISRQHWFFFTHDNGSVFYFLPLLGAVWYYACEKGRYYWLAVVLSALTLYMYWSLWSVAAMVSVTLAVFFFVIIWRTDCRRIRQFMTYRRALLIGIGFCVIVLVFYSSDLINGIAAHFGKAGDLGRGRIWMRAIPFFLASPVFGVGFESDATTLFKLGINHCHNIILQILYTGGLLAFFLFLLGLLKCSHKNDHGIGPVTKGQVILCFTIVALFVASTFDWYLYMPMQFFPFVLYYYSSDEIGTTKLTE